MQLGVVVGLGRRECRRAVRVVEVQLWLLEAGIWWREVRGLEFAGVVQPTPAAERGGSRHDAGDGGEVAHVAHHQFSAVLEGNKEQLRNYIIETTSSYIKF